MCNIILGLHVHHNPSTRQVHNLHMAQAIRMTRDASHQSHIYATVPLYLTPISENELMTPQGLIISQKTLFLTLHHLQLERVPIEVLYHQYQTLRQRIYGSLLDSEYLLTICYHLMQLNSLNIKFCSSI